MIKKLAFFVLFALSSVFVQAQNVISVEAFEQKIKEKNIQILDVRTPEEVSKGKIAGATVINFRDTDFKTQIQKLDKNRPVAVYCGGGVRSNKAAKMLIELGYKNVFDLQGGLSAWLAKGKSVVK